MQPKSRILSKSLSDKDNEQEIQEELRLNQTEFARLDPVKIQPNHQNQESTQQNRQDLDQVQNTNINPKLHNSQNVQNVQVVIQNTLENFSGQIVGTTHIDGTGEPLGNVNLLLYFGNTTGIPVEDITSDDNGHFSIKDLPPGYYTLHACIDKEKITCLPNIKILPGSTVPLCIMI